MRNSTALLLLFVSIQSAHGIDLSNHRQWLFPDDDPCQLVEAFIAADSEGMQTSSEYWPLVQRFTDWKDGPGYDEVTVVRSYDINSLSVNDNGASVSVTYEVIGRMYQTGNSSCPSGYCQQIDSTVKGRQSVVFLLRTDGTRWWIASPSEGPKISVQVAYRWVTESKDNCRQGICAKDPVAKLLKRYLSQPASQSFHGTCSKSGAVQ